MGVHYQSNCAWRLVKIRRRSPVRDLPARVHTWEGREDELDAFLDAHPVGAAHADGWIIDHDVRQEVPKSEVDLILAFAPDFEAAVIENSTAIKVFTRTGDVADPTSIFSNADTLQAKRQVSARVAQTVYRYFADEMPIGFRYTATATDRNPVILSEQIELTGLTTSNPPVKIEASYPSFASAPAAVQDAVEMDIENSQESHVSANVPGTPWYHCTDVIVKGYEEAAP